MFDFLQMKAKNLGIKNGEYIDYFTGEIIKSEHIEDKNYQTEIDELKKLKQSILPTEEFEISKQK